MKTSITTLFFFLCFTATSQIETYNLKFQEFRNSLSTDSIIPVELRITRMDSVTTYEYFRPNGVIKYEVRFESDFGKYSSITHYVDGVKSKNYGYGIFLNELEEHPKHGNLYRLTGNLRGKYSGAMDGGSGGLFSDKYGLICLKGFMTQSGEVLMEIDGKIIPSKQRLLWYRK